MKYKKNSKEDFIKLVQSEILTSSEVLEELKVSRQSLSSLVKRGKLTPIKELPRVRLFLREDVEARKEIAKEIQAKYNTVLMNKQ
ncbi:helix-turn-helix transcriptional regulator [Lysinibacillus sp. NPDC056959]|uniref:helix-turn-helix transcriptional regulator n=1 Tax=Lysinibacillus sp. NPDC056959 TaxID=3345981 RepID=UPI00363D1359